MARTQVATGSTIPTSSTAEMAKSNVPAAAAELETSVEPEDMAEPTLRMAERTRVAEPAGKDWAVQSTVAENKLFT